MMMMQAQSVYWLEDTTEVVMIGHFCKLSLILFRQCVTFLESVSIPTIPATLNFNRPIFLEDLDCRPTDVDILQCNTFSTIGIHSCSHLQDVSVKCTGK